MFLLCVFCVYGVYFSELSDDDEEGPSSGIPSLMSAAIPRMPGPGMGMPPMPPMGRF